MILSLISGMDNIFLGIAKKEFYVWVDPNDVLVKHNAGLIGQLFSGSPKKDDDLLPFVSNPDQKYGFLSPFLSGVIREYRTEYNLELSRRWYFQDYPSRLAALFLFETKHSADKYHNIHPEHVGGRKLIRVESEGNCVFSRHDIGWIDILYSSGGQDDNFIHYATKSYWEGLSAQGVSYESMSNKKLAISNYEILYMGRTSVLDEL